MTERIYYAIGIVVAMVVIGRLFLGHMIPK